jgi:PPM family protein phosphatase
MQIPLVEQRAIETAACTDVGNVRTLNEDSIAVVASDEPIKRDKGTMLVVADGLGGNNAGEVASRLVATKLPELYFTGCEQDYASDLVNAVQVCNRMVNEASEMSAELQGMGTTLVAAVIIGQYVLFVNVGDSRGYLLRETSVIHRTKDHSLKDASLDVPGFSARNRFSHVLTRAIGPKPNILIDITAHEILRGDIVLLCSDGLTNCVTDEEMKDVLFHYPCADSAQMLVDLAKERGGEDNISVAVANIVDFCPRRVDSAHLSGFSKYLI